MRSPDDETLPLMVHSLALSGAVVACNRSPRRHSHGGTNTPRPPPDARLGVLGRQLAFKCLVEARGVLGAGVVFLGSFGHAF